MRNLKRPRILVVGSYMMDLISSAERLPGMGETVIGNNFCTAPGGKGANQAVQCARLGADVIMAGGVGDDAFGREMLQTAIEAGVDVSHVKISRQHCSGVGNVQIQTQDGHVQNRIVVIPGANYDLLPEDLAWLEGEITSFDMVMLQLELRMDTTKYAANLAARAGVPVMLNPAPACPLDADLLSAVTYLSPNEYEASLLAKHPLRSDAPSQEDLREIAAEILASGIDNLIITLGENGSSFFSNSESWLCRSVPMQNVKDPTAAGDSFVGAFCTARSAGLSEKEALLFAGFAAAITVCSVGAMPSLPYLQDVISLMNERSFSDFDVRLLDVLKRP